ncbi:MAG: hypothetical protein GY862_00825 [Gammaproteobacteria bacterium]|nr:hypothetical protein [Gammaproteobacteria bacterium]
MNYRSLLFVLVIFLSGLLPDPASAREEVGFVISCKCPRNSCAEPGNPQNPPISQIVYLKKKKRREPLYSFKPLIPEDKVLITRNSACSAALRLGADRLTLDDKGRPFHEIESREPPPLWKRVYAMFFPSESSVKTGGARRGYADELVIPIFAALPGKKYLLAGKSGLYLTWKGGLPPYTVCIYPQGGECREQSVEFSGLPAIAAEAYLELPRALMAGQSYWLEIHSDAACEEALRDPKRCHAEGRFSVVEAERFPAMPAEIQQMEGSELDHMTFFVAWLLAPENRQRQWMLEAYQRIVQVREQKQPDRDALSEELSERIIHYGFR